ncbi:DUF3990 domain-containing protein [Brevibacillus reuszeri]|uniref:DUF3990 domain-containing protein n=1 Tax=Brevibacillus reuszeri TaxID=54915 RepID=UPI0013E087AB|nr:DUF3990 domain-containing protein [Brevibacillus reuszeri]
MSIQRTSYASEIEMPEFVYHGTTFNNLDDFKKELISDNDSFYPKNRDFGSAFYTTIDIEQAKQWGKIKEDRSIARGKKQKGLVLQIKVNHIKVEEQNPTFRIFLSSTIPWAQFIHDNRIKEIDYESTPDIIIGPMADNRIADVIDDFQANERTIQQFRDTIMRTPGNKLLDDKQLGQQIAFCNRLIAREVLTISEYYVLDKGRWHQHEL